MNNELFELAKNELEKSKVIAFPTETVMGFGVFYNDIEAYNLLNKIKRRPEDKPYTLMLSKVEDIEKYAYLTYRDRVIINKFMPGPLTVLLRAKENVPTYVTHGSGIIGIRVPNMQNIRDMIDYCQKPLLVPSANRSGEKPLNKYLEVKKEFEKEIDFVYPEDALGNKPSTIIDSTNDKIKIIREGDIKLSEIEGAINMYRISIGSDHGGYEYKQKVIEHLTKQGHQVIDVGTNSLDSCHYPIFGEAAARKVSEGECDFAVVICTSGEGIMMAANKVKGVRCGLAYNDEVAKLMRQHNNANAIAFGQKFMNLEDVLRRIDIFLSTEFEGGRHQQRVDLISEIETK